METKTSCIAPVTVSIEAVTVDMAPIRPTQRM